MKTSNLPSGYVQYGDLFHDLKDTPEWYWIVMGNLMALVPLGVALGVLWLPYQFYLALGTPLALLPDPVFPDWLKVVAGTAIIAASMLLHELLHGAALLILGYRARLNYAMGYFYATVAPRQFLTRTHYMLTALTPLLTMTLGGGMLLLFLPPTWGQLLLIALLLNAAASVGDLAVAARAMRYPANALFTDEAGIKVYVMERDV